MEDLQKREEIINHLIKSEDLLKELKAVEILEYYNKNWLACGKNVSKQKQEYINCLLNINKNIYNNIVNISR